ncbi:putative bifunctional diguanylate cyclase/phosphodiesterase [Pseudomonas sp. NPDC077382]
MHISKRIKVESVILIIEDQATDALALSEAVRDLGDVRMASDGPSGLALARQYKPDLVLLDIELYGMNGFAVCKALKADPKLCDAAIIFVTSHGQIDNELRALEYGGIGFICKPLNIPVARAHIKAHLALRHEAKKLANHDALTGLPNRTLLQDRTEQAIQKAHRSQTRVAMLLLDLDNFKSINDAVGHSVGDALLTQVAERLSEAVRELDTVSRQGGDEFIMLLPEVSGFELVGHFAERLLASIATPFMLNGDRFELGASIGISVFPDDSDNADSLYSHADAAMYQAKQEGRNRFRFFSADIESKTRGRHRLEQHMRAALDEGVFEVFYQAKVAAKDARVVGMEALIRWRNSDGSLTSPADFIPLAEETGLIIPIGKSVLRQACLDAQVLADRGTPVLVSVNISAIQFLDESFLQMVQEILLESKLMPSCLELEITEGVLAKDVRNTQFVLGELRRQGVRIAIDDFGTGYSSLAYLKRFPIDVLKIDQSFVRDMLVARSDAAIIEAIIKLAQALDLELVAEGVETHEQADALRRCGCHTLQGYLYSRPEPFNQFCALLDARIV